MKKLLPPFLFIIFALGMGVVCWALDTTHYLGYPFNLIGLPLFIFGLYIVESSKNLFKRESTNVFTFDKPDKLITSGFFKYSRNPMYLGFVVALFGVALLYQASLSSLILAMIFAIIVDRWYIAFEERMMQETFGESYTQYAAKTRRWI
jgi:protein-S-isoprenylcysteine O-methyltransferase Ste14